jgi:hypothetical protein
MQRTTSLFIFVLVASAFVGCSSNQSCPICPVCPTPMPTQTPTPSPTPYVPPAQPDHCTETIPLFEDAVFLAIAEVENEAPEWFDFSGMPPIALEPGKFQKAVIDKINAQPPLQAAKGWFDSWAVVSVKDSDELSEDYHILSSSCVVRKKYGQTCRPATF